MPTAKINFEMDTDVLANAQAFAAKNRISLNKLVTSYFSSLGRDHQTTNTGGPIPILLEVSTGKLSLTDAAKELGLIDGGHVLALMRQHHIPLSVGGLPKHFLKAQSEEILDTLRLGLLPPKSTSSAQRSSRLQNE